MKTDTKIVKISNTGDCNTGCFNTGDFNTGDFNTGDHNTGDYNTGDCNTGCFNTSDFNTGDFNTGDFNTGDHNTGGCNTGDCNTGGCNTGDYNTGYYNTGDYNTGYYNTGDFNTGDYNAGHHNTGYFNTSTPRKILVFNKECERVDWVLAEKPSFLFFDLSVWIPYDEMTIEEIAEHEACKIMGGYLKIMDYKEAFQQSFNNLSEQERKIQVEQLKKLPNFDSKIFYEISGINIEDEDLSS